MNRWLFLTLFCFWALAACESKRVRVRDTLRHGKSDDRSGNGEVHGQDVIPTGAELDSSLLSLKKGPWAATDDVMSQDWKLDDADQPHWNEVFWDSSSDTRQYPELALFRDYSVTENARCRMRTGKWKLYKESRALILRFGDGFSRIYFIKGIAMKQMELIWRKTPNDSVLIKLSADAAIHKRSAEDPYHPVNNDWRIKPKASETDEQLRLRLKQCVHFYALFFHDNNQRQLTEISFSGLPTCFVWYNGGIGMEARADLDKKWIDCFYSTFQALKAYEMLSSILRKHDLKWPEHPTSWVKQTAEVLDQLCDKL
ncbi:MAG TPA: hypothetical protein VK563_07725 [Puia sp.]|nr:hypothetical protein [Puia sp.]